MTQYTQIRSTPLSDKRGSCLRNALVLLVAAAVPMQAVAGDALLRFDSRQELLDAGDELLADLDPEVSGLRIEDFSDSFIRFLPRGEFAACTEPLDSDSSDACFAPGGLEAGFTIRSSHRYGVIMPGPDILGTSDALIGGWPYRINPSSLNFTQLDFSGGPVLFGADVYSFRIAGGESTGESAPVLVEAFDTEDELIGEFTVEPSTANQPAFAGFFSPRPLGRVQIGTREQAAGTFIAQLHFGGSGGRLTATPAALEFGSAAVGGVASRVVTLTNEGVLDVQVESLEPLAEPFILGSEDCTGQVLASGGSCSFEVRFTPRYIDTFHAILQIEDDAGSATTVAIRGGGVAGGGQ